MRPSSYLVPSMRAVRPNTDHARHCCRSEEPSHHRRAGARARRRTGSPSDRGGPGRAPCPADWQTCAVERLTAGDASFLYMENPKVHMHVIGVLMLDPSTRDGGFSYDEFRDHVAGRLHQIPLFRQRLLRTPFGLDHPVWADDPGFDIENHVSHLMMPDGQGSNADLKTWLGDFASIPLDFDKPVWEMVAIEGLDSGYVAIASKIHHVAVDGTTGTDLMTQIIDLEPDRIEEEPPPFDPRPLPTKLELAAHGAISRALDPLRGPRALRRTVRSAIRVARQIRGAGEDGGTMARPFDAPRTFFNRSLTRRRSIAFTAASLDDLKFTKTTFGFTVNDVFLAACTQALRRYLTDHGEFLTRPLVVSVPVSVRGQPGAPKGQNQVSNMFVRLPVHLEDPIAQLAAIHVDTKDAKAVHGALAANIIGDVTDIATPAIFNLGSRMYSGARLAERLTPIHNLVISNVPGPPIPLFANGMRIAAVYPFGPLVEGAGINITALSNMGNVDIGIIACPDVAPDIDDLAEGIVEGIRVLRAAADERGGPASCTASSDGSE